MDALADDGGDAGVADAQCVEIGAVARAAAIVAVAMRAALEKEGAALGCWAGR